VPRPPRTRGRVCFALRLFALSIMLAALLAPPASAAAPTVTAPSPPLTAAWWQTFLSTPGDSFSRCDLGQGNIVFLAGTTGGTARRSCTLTAGTSVLVSPINGECSQVEGNGDTPAELRACASGQADAMTNLSLSLTQGREPVPVPQLSTLRVASPVFEFNAVAGNVFGIAPGPSRSVSDGFWALIGPLKPGPYTLSFGGAVPTVGFTTQATYRLTVV
jgi:hypothetical protein